MGYKENRFSEVKTNLDNLFGWWQCVTTGDLDGDGKLDLVLGNIGDNFYLRPNEKSPAKLWVGDFDKDFAPDKIITRTVSGKDMPVFLKKEMVDQFPFLKKQNLHYQDFARKSVGELFSPESMKNTEVSLFNYTSSCIAYNDGNGKFTIKRLPEQMQLSSVNVAHCIDINFDGKPDVIAGGNQYGFPPQFGRLDASRGDVLINDGSREMRWIRPKQSGLNFKGEVRDIVPLKGGKDAKILVLINNDYPSLYKVNSADGL